MERRGLTVRELISALQDMPDQGASAVLYVDGVEHLIVQASLAAPPDAADARAIPLASPAISYPEHTSAGDEP